MAIAGYHSKSNVFMAVTASVVEGITKIISTLTTMISTRQFDGSCIMEGGGRQVALTTLLVPCNDL